MVQKTKKKKKRKILKKLRVWLHPGLRDGEPWDMFIRELSGMF